MAKREPKLPQNVRLLQARFSAAQREFDRQFQAQLSEYTTETIPEFEEQIAGYEQRANDYLNRTNQYSDYVSSFFIKPGTNDVEQFVKYGNNYYWAEDVPGGFNLKGIGGLPALSGGAYQFVQTGSRPHQYSYSEQVWVPSSRLEMRPYQTYEYQMRSSYELVYTPPTYNYGGYGGYGSSWYSSTGGYEYKLVTRNVYVPVTRYRMENIDTSSWQWRTTFAREDLPVGYLKTLTPEGDFTSLRPEQFAIRSSPGEFTEQVPEAPPGMDISGIKQQLESEKAYYQRETGEMSAATREARMRRRVRPLLS